MGISTQFIVYQRIFLDMEFSSTAIIFSIESIQAIYLRILVGLDTNSIWLKRSNGSDQCADHACLKLAPGKVKSQIAG